MCYSFKIKNCPSHEKMTPGHEKMTQRPPQYTRWGRLWDHTHEQDFACSPHVSCEHAHYAGRRTDFRDKKSSGFTGEIFRERNYCPRTAFSGSNSCSILSNHVISWNGSRADRCPLGREITAKTCSLLGNEGTPPDFERFFLEKRPWKRFSTNVLIRGHMNPLHSQLMGTKL